MDKKETTETIANFIEFNSIDIASLYQNNPEIGNVFTTVLNALSKEYGSGEEFDSKLEALKVVADLERKVEKEKQAQDIYSLNVGDKVYVPAIKQGKQITTESKNVNEARAKAQPYLYVTKISSLTGSDIVLNVVPEYGGGDYFYINEVVAYPGNYTIGDKFKLAAKGADTILEIVSYTMDREGKVDIIFSTTNIAGNIEVNQVKIDALGFRNAVDQNTFIQLSETWKEQRDIFIKNRIIDNLSPELKNLAIEAINKQRKGSTLDLSNSLSSFFDWAKSSQGYTFWEAINDGNWDVYYDNPSQWEQPLQQQSQEKQIDPDDFNSLIGFTIGQYTSRKWEKYKVLGIKKVNPKRVVYNVEAKDGRIMELGIDKTMVYKLLRGQMVNNVYIDELVNLSLDEKKKKIKNLEALPLKQPKSATAAATPSAAPISITSKSQAVSGTSKLNIDTLPALVNYYITINPNEGDRPSPSQSAGELYRVYSKEPYANSILGTLFKGNDGNWYKLVERTNKWLWIRAKPEEVAKYTIATTNTNYGSMSQTELKTLQNEISEAMSLLDDTDEEYQELKQQLNEISKYIK